jgi:hypothetical protein
MSEISGERKGRGAGRETFRGRARQVPPLRPRRCAQTPVCAAPRAPTLHSTFARTKRADAAFNVRAHKKTPLLTAPTKGRTSARSEPRHPQRPRGRGGAGVRARLRSWGGSAGVGEHLLKRG